MESNFELFQFESRRCRRSFGVKIRGAKPEKPGFHLASCNWTAAQALAVFEVLDDLRDLVVAGYAKKIQQAARLDRTVTTPSLPANIDNGDVPF